MGDDDLALGETTGRPESSDASISSTVVPDPAPRPISTFSPTSPPPPPSIPTSHLHLTPSQSHTLFPRLSSTYPLKLLIPRLLATPPHTGLAYTLTYGGGLVSGDATHLHAVVGAGGTLVLLTQGSTKVFRARPGGARRSGGGEGAAVQRLEVDVLGGGGMLVLLPDPVQPFAGSAFKQEQDVRLAEEEGSSVVLLDWYTSGRHARGEAWAFASYTSINTISHPCSTQPIMRDALQLRPTRSSPLPTRMAPYTTYLTLLLSGPRTARLRGSFAARFAREPAVHQRSRPARFVWSVSDVAGGRGAVVRAASEDEEELRRWLRGALEEGGLDEELGKEVWARCLR